MKRKRKIPDIVEGGYSVHAISVCGIEDIIGTDSDYCSLHYSAADVSYDYGYDYNGVYGEYDIMAYYVGNERFFKKDGSYDKEYVLYEYAVFESPDELECGDLLFRYLTTLAEAMGCSRIICNSRGMSAEFCAFLSERGFASVDGDFVLELPKAKMSEYDLAVIPTDKDSLGFYELLFLREHDFNIGEEKCTYSASGESITVDRRSGECSFSGGIRVEGNGTFILSDSHTLSQIHICRELLRIGNTEITVIPKSLKMGDTTPDVFSQGWGIFIDPDNNDDMLYMREFRNKLKREGLLDSFGTYSYSFDTEVGGERSCLAQIKLK